MSHTVVMQFIGNFGKVKLIIYQQFFYLFYFIGQVILLNGSSLNFGKKIKKVCVIVIEFLAQVIGKVCFDLIFIIVNQLNNKCKCSLSEILFYQRKFYSDPRATNFKAS
jgi:putative cell wall-binding protein